MKTAYFDYNQAAKRANISAEALKEIEEEVRKEFPDDQMMFELHVLRVINSVLRRKGRQYHPKDSPGN